MHLNQVIPKNSRQICKFKTRYRISSRVRLKQSLRLGREDLCQYNSVATPCLQIETTEVRKKVKKEKKNCKQATRERIERGKRKRRIEGDRKIVEKERESECKR
jgi:hypothetical protein